jgi:flagellar protein FliS
MMHSHNRAAQYASVRSQGQVADASPTRLVQVMFEHIVSNLTIAQACMERIEGNLPLRDVIAKGKAMGKAVRLIGQLDATLNMDKGGEVAVNLRNLYRYMLDRLTVANIKNDAQLVAEVLILVRKVKSGWDPLVEGTR